MKTIVLLILGAWCCVIAGCGVNEEKARLMAKQEAQKAIEDYKMSSIMPNSCVSKSNNHKCLSS